MPIGSDRTPFSRSIGRITYKDADSEVTPKSECQYADPSLTQRKPSDGILIQSFPKNGLGWFDILVNLKEIGWIVFALNFYEAIIVLAVGGFDSIGSFVHHEVHIGAAQTVRMDGRPIVLRPFGYFFGIHRIRINSDNNH
jgi:hypothetical protein